MHESGLRLLHGVSDERLVMCVESVEGENVALGADEEERLSLEERSNGAEECDLLVDGVVALAAGVDEEEDGGLEMRQRSDRLHLDGVAVLDRVVQNARRVDDLPANVRVVHVTEEERFRGERVRLHVHVRSGHCVHEARLPHVRKPAQDQGAISRVDGRKTVHVLAHLLQVAERGVQLLQDGAHAT